MLTNSVTTEVEEGYKLLETLVFDKIKDAKWPLFLTNATELDQTYLAFLNQDRRQHYNCNCCKAFFNKYGPLVTIDDYGITHSLLFKIDGVPPFFEVAWERLNDRVARAQITDVFLTKDLIWGHPLTTVHDSNPSPIREWTHFSGPNMAVFDHPLLSPAQVMAEKKQDYGMLCHGLSDYPMAVAYQALRILEADAVERPEKAIGVARWFLELHELTKDLKGLRRTNLIWKAVAKAPPGFCHIRSTMISTLLDDLKQGLSVEIVARKWKEKMHPLQYQRPTAPVSEGTIKQANAIVEKLGSAGALTRRYAKIEDIKCFWKPVPSELSEPMYTGGVFDHLRTRPVEPTVTLPSQTKTWVNFLDKVMPDVLEIQVRLPHSGAFSAFITAENALAPPILQWDTDPRNPVTWYLYANASRADVWNLTPGVYHKVNGLCYLPPHWYHLEKFQHHFQGLFFILDGCRDTRHTKGGLFFPEELLAEYHSIRSAMEAYAKHGSISGRDQATACGMMLQKGVSWGLDIKVRTKGGLAHYKLDRWE